MKFAHIADCHIGAWGDPKLKELSNQAFLKAVDVCIEEKVDFVLVSGDLFNTSLPPVDRLKEAVVKLKQLKDLEIPVYIIAGSHDFSPSGKTMLDVLEKAGLCVNIARGKVEDDKLKLGFTFDPKTGAKITGMIGRKGMLEKSYYEELDREHLEKEQGFKIFMFHTALTELKPQEMERMDSAPLSLLPKGFDYYAGGHVHVKQIEKMKDYGTIVYPGPLFPNNFKELETDLGGFYIYNNGELTFKNLNTICTHAITLDCEAKSPEQVGQELLDAAKGRDFTKTIVLLRLEGTLSTGKPSDIDFKSFFNQLYGNQNAYFVMKTTSKLKSKEFEEVKVSSSSVDELELNLINENIGQFEIGRQGEEEVRLIQDLMQTFGQEKKEGETNRDFEERIQKEIDIVVGV